jgi:hypothetical protein
MGINDWLFDDDPKLVDRFGLLLVITAAVVIVLSLVDFRLDHPTTGTQVGNVFVTGTVGVMAIIVSRSCGFAVRIRIAVGIVVVLSLLGSAGFLLGDLLDGDIADSASGPSVLWIILMITLPIGVTRRIIQHDRVTVATLIGAISAYLLIAITFAFIYIAVDAWQPGHFFGSEESSTNYIYFSLTTMTTLGYGDLTAESDLGRMLAVSQAVIGQIFLVTLVAALVARYTQDTRRDR